MVNGKGILFASFALGMGALTQPALADVGQTGIASYYWQGRGTASGERFNPSALTAAHRSLPFNTKVKVTNLRNGRSVVVRINDRGPFVRGRIIDVSRAAASELGFTGNGVTKVSVAVMGRDSEVAVTETPDSGKAKETRKTRVAYAENPAPEASTSAAETKAVEAKSTEAKSTASANAAAGWTLVPSPGMQQASAAAQPAE